MAIAKVILNGEVQMDVTSDTVEANKLLEGETATKNDGTKVTGTFVAPDPVISSLSVTPTESEQIFNEVSISGYKPVTVGAIASDYIGSAIPRRDNTDPNLYTTASYLSPSRMETYMAVPSGYYQSRTTKGIQQDIASISGIPTLSAQTITPTESTQYISSYQWLTGSQTIEAIPSTYVGSAIPMRSSADLTQSYYVVSAPSGYYSESPRYELPRYSHLAPEIRVQKSNGYIYADHDAYDVMMNNGLITGEAYIQSLYKLSTLSAQTITPTESVQYISSYQWLTGSQTIAGDPNLVGSNIVSGISIFGVQGTYEGGGNTDRSGDIIEKTISGTYENSQIAYIGAYAFYSCKELKNAVFLNATSAGSHAFEWCLSLSTVSIPNLSIVEESMFQMCWNLTAADFPNVTRVKTNGFSSCNKLTTVSMPSVISVGYAAFNQCYSLSAIFFPNATSIGVNAFGGCSNLTTVSLPSLTSIGANAFINCSNLDSISLSNISIITSSLFQSCYKLSIVDIPNAEKIYDSAFAFCSGLIVASFPNVTQMSSRAFAGCTNLTTAYFPKLSIISAYTFNSCNALITLSFPSVTTIYVYAFHSCNGLVNVEFPNVSVIGGGAFSNCGSLTTISFPQATDINHDAFLKCFNLTMVSFPKAVFIGTSAFTSCSVLSSVYLLGSSVVALSSTNAFLSTPIYNNGSIYVPTSLYASYIVASNWSRFSSQIVSLTDEEIAAL